MNNDVTPPSNNKPEADTDSVPVTVNSGKAKPSADVTPPVTSDATVSSQPEESTTEPATDNGAAAPAVVTTENPTPADFGKKSGWGKRLVFIVVIVALLGGAVWAAMQLNTPSKPAVSTTTKKDVDLVRIGIQEPMLSDFYPHTEANNIDYEINEQVFEGLTKFENKTKVVPALATSWTNPDNSTWVFKLRSNVKFHNGNVMTAQYVKNSLDATQGSDILGEFNSTIKSVEVVDPSTVKIKTDGPDPLLLNKLTFLNIYDTKGKANDAANGTGPYTLKAGAQSSSNLVQLTAFNGYWGNKTHVHEVDYVYYQDDQGTLSALQQNKLEIGTLNDESLIPKAGAGFKKFASEGDSIALMVPNTLKAGSPLSNKTVRQAIYTALNPVSLMKSRGATGMPASQPVPSAIPGYDPSIKRPATDTAKAKQLLAQAGYPNGFTMKFTYFKNAENLIVEIQKELAAIGITVTLDPQTSGPTLQKIAFSGQTDAYYYTNGSDLIDSSDVYDGLVFQQKNYSNPTLAKLNTEQATIIDAPKRLKLLQQMNNTFMSDYGVFPLYEPVGHTFAARSNLHLEQQSFSSLSGLYFDRVYGE